MDELEKLKEENEELKSKLIDLLFEQNYSIEKELAEFVRSLYESTLNVDKKLTKENIIKNLKKSIEQFAKDYKFKL
jgi:predicted RNase H-like nuclease (RuvC/YqgF family)